MVNDTIANHRLGTAGRCYPTRHRSITRQWQRWTRLRANCRASHRDQCAPPLALQANRDLVPLPLFIANAPPALQDAVHDRHGLDLRAVLMAIVIGGSLAYVTPIGMPANVMVLGPGGYAFKDYTKAGLPLILASTIVSMTLLPILFPFFP